MFRHHARSLFITGVLLGIIAAFFVLPRMLQIWGGDKDNKLQIPPGTSFPVTVRDTCDRNITIPQRPSRIVSLAPGVTEFLFAIGAGDRVVAATKYCDYPEAARALPKIGGYLDPSIEKITAFHPDLIVGQRGNQRDILDRLYKLGLPIVVIDPTVLKEIPQSILFIGRITGNMEQAKSLAQQFTAREERVVAKLAKVPEADRPRTLFLFSLDDQGGVFTVGPGSHIHEMITLSGGVNIAAKVNNPWPQISMETVAAADPQVILVMLMQEQGASNGMTNEMAMARLKRKTNWRGISALKHRKVFLLNDDLTTIPGPRLIDGLEAMADVLHPGIFAKSEEK